MAAIDYVTIEAADANSAEQFNQKVFDLSARVRTRTSDAPTSGFRGFTLSLLVSQPSVVADIVRSAVEAGAEPLKPPAKSLWGYGGAVQAPDGTVWTVASSTKKDTGPPSRETDELVLQLGVADVAASKQFYVDQGFEVAKSYGRRYVEFGPASSPVKLALYKRRSLTKLAGIPPAGTGSHRLVIVSEAGSFTDPDGFQWERT